MAFWLSAFFAAGACSFRCGVAMNCRIDFPQTRGAIFGSERLRCRFGAPRRTLQAQGLAQVMSVLDAVQEAAREGQWCVGWVRYEAAPAFDPAFSGAVHAPTPGVPLAWFAVHDAPAHTGSPHGGAHARILWEEGLEREEFDRAIARIHAAIAAGDCYQVNYTALLRGRLMGRAEDLFEALRREQPGGYVAWIDRGDEQVLSVSPELFFDWDGETLLTRPMKGTAPRGHTPAEDAALAAAMRDSPKERAENVMIVDLLRNDVSRIALPHSVEVPRLFHVEPLPSVWQMTSDVQALTRPGTRLSDVFTALFPCGSVTGAPKRQAMRLIRELEPQPRGIYCGAVGVVRPGKTRGGIHATFNVPIRTVVVQGDQVCCGIGSGVTSDAVAPAEWQEWRNKKVFVLRASAGFDLVETLALRDGHVVNLERHLLRMQSAARHFSRPWRQPDVLACLNAVCDGRDEGLWRVRLTLNAQGQAGAQAYPFQDRTVPVSLQLASRPLPDAVARGEWVQFKTSWRSHYEAFSPVDPAVFDTVLYNEGGELTECTRGSIAALLDGHWVTPPLACGLLPGVGRAVALEQGHLTERVIHLEDVPRVKSWAFVNSLRGWLDATLKYDGGGKLPTCSCQE